MRQGRVDCMFEEQAQGGTGGRVGGRRGLFRAHCRA